MASFGAKVPLKNYKPVIAVIRVKERDVPKVLL